jgi:hypothetical protein
VTDGLFVGRLEIVDVQHFAGPGPLGKKLVVSQFECGKGPQVASIALVTYSRAAL